LEFSELLRSAANLLQNIDADKAGSLIHELAAALNGRADSLRALTTASDELSATFAAKTDVLDRLATNNTRLTHVLGDHAGDLGQSLTNLSQLADSLRNANGNTAVLLEQGSQLMGQLADLVGTEKGNLDCVLHDLSDVIDASSTAERLDGLDYLLGNGKSGFDLVVAAIDNEADGPWARVNLMATPTDPAPQYVPPHALPAVPQVPACASTIGQASGPDFVPSEAMAAATTHTVDVPGVSTIAALPRTGGVWSAALGVAALFLAAFVALRRVRGAAR
jgi:phospholipid/cholesterol/gamma-HCH transport system substrate-binding protein